MSDETKPVDATEDSTQITAEQGPVADATGDAGTDSTASEATPAAVSEPAQGPADASNPMAQTSTEPADPFGLPTPSETSDSSPSSASTDPLAPSDVAAAPTIDAGAEAGDTSSTTGNGDAGQTDAPAGPASDEPPAIEPPLLDNSAEAIEPPKAPEPATPSVPGDSEQAAGGQVSDQGGSSASTPSSGESTATDNTTGGGAVLSGTGVSTIDEHPAPSENPAVHPQTGLPLDGDSLLGGGEAEASKGQGGAQGGGEAAAPAPADAAPTAVNVPDAYTKLTADGAKLADALDELAKDAGAVLVLDLKAAGNYAAHIVDTLQLVLDQGGRKKNKRQLENLLDVFRQVESTVEPLLEKNSTGAGSDTLEDNAAAQLSGIEELVLGMFKKLKAD